MNDTPITTKDMIDAGFISPLVLPAPCEYDFSASQEEKAIRRQETLFRALSLLNPRFIRCLIGSSQVARKSLALIMHDRLLTGYPRALPAK